LRILRKNIKEIEFSDDKFLYMIIKQKVTLFLLIASLVNMTAQDSDPGELSLVFYNVENLFDTLDATGFKDTEFTPGGDKNWNTARYHKKLNDLAKVIGSASNTELPDIIGLAEVENYAVLADLAATESLGKANYKIVHYESPDFRGIDVAFMYKVGVLSGISHSVIPIVFPFDSSLTTRDILYVSGKAEDGKRIHFFINHWSSRIGGVKKTEPKRLYSAVSLRKKIDLLLSRESDPRIVIMGDFNDDPTNRSLMQLLMAGNKRKNIGPGDLYNLFYDQHNFGEAGSYNFRGTWNMLDQIIVSYNLIMQDGFYSCDFDDGRIIKEDWMLYEKENGQLVPNRTYGGPNYFGGISDHLPVSVVFRINNF